MENFSGIQKKSFFFRVNARICSTVPPFTRIGYISSKNRWNICYTVFHLFHRKGVIQTELRDYQIETIGKTALAWRNGYRRPCIVIDHVGNVHRFGLPDQDRTWSLEPKPQKTQENTVHVRQCPQCFFTHNSAPKCPNCGHVYEKTKEEILEEKKEQELIRIERKMEHIESAAECSSAKELFAFAKKKGYKPGWAYHQAKERGFL